MLFVLFFVVAIFAAALTGEVAVRGSDNIASRASVEVSDAVARTKAHVDDTVGALRAANVVFGTVLMLIQVILRFISAFLK
jgi:hypothetical protein